VEIYGTPNIIQDQGKLRIFLENLPEVQSLFAFDEGDGSRNLIGVMVYVRQDTETFLVIHLGVHDIYSSVGERADEVLIIKFINELKRIARKIKGIKKINLLYGRGKNSIIPI
jgi:hypothetical protein